MVFRTLIHWSSFGVENLFGGDRTSTKRLPPAIELDQIRSDHVEYTET